MDLDFSLKIADEMAALFEGRDLMVVPVSDAEVVELRKLLLGLGAFLLRQMQEWEARLQSTERPAEWPEQAERALQTKLDQARAAHAASERIRELLGRAIFAEDTNRGGMLQ